MIAIKHSASLRPPSEGVEGTALMMTAKRAIAQSLPDPDRLVEDPFSVRLAEPELEALCRYWGVTPDTPDSFKRRLTRNIIVRTRFFDDCLMRHSESIKQIVILGSGLDTRAYRLSCLQGATVYEIDHADLLNYKQQVLSDVQPFPVHHLIPGDLTKDWVSKLLDTEFEPTQPTFWLAEGVLMYLNESDVHYVLFSISHLSATGSMLGCDLISEGSLRAGNNTPHGRVGKYWKFGTDHPQQLLLNYGWQSDCLPPSDPRIEFGQSKRSDKDHQNGRGTLLVLATL